MKIRMKVDLSGSHDGKRWPARGEVVDLAENVATHLVANGTAEAVDAEPEVESATASDGDVETATKSTRPRKRTKNTED